MRREMLLTAGNPTARAVGWIDPARRAVLLAALAGAGAAAQTAAPAAGATPAAEWFAAELPGLIELYRDLHRRPELSFREVRTAARFARELEAAGLEVTRDIGGLGVVGVLRNGDGPCLLLRADLDALPIGEQTGLDYRSELRSEDEQGRVAGVMHACGHDLHMTNLVGVARWLAAERGGWRGTVVCIGQPAEERAGGAKAMLADGLLERFPRPDFAVALHVAHDLEAGTVGWRAGPALANVESVDVTMFGRGGHGSAPHMTVDPVMQAAELVVALQTIVSREVSPLEPAVVTVGSIHGGSKHNIIGDRCHLQITVRSYDDDVHAHVIAAIRRKAAAVAQSARAPAPAVATSEYTPALVNDPALTARAVAAFRRELGEERVVEVEAVMGAEDFGRLRGAGLPIFMFRLGTVAAERLAAYAGRGEAPPPLHSPFYYPDAEPSLRAGIRAMVAAARELLPP